MKIVIVSLDTGSPVTTIDYRNQAKLRDDDLRKMMEDLKHQSADEFVQSWIDRDVGPSVSFAQAKFMLMTSVRQLLSSLKRK